VVGSDRFFAFLDVQRGVGKARALQLAKLGWCDGATDWIEVHVALFNAEVRAFAHVLVRFDFTSGGEVATHLEVRPLFLPEWTTTLMALDIVWGFLVVALLFATVQETFDRKDAPNLFVRCCGDAWMVLDWLGTLVGAGLLGFFYLLVTGIGLLAGGLADFGSQDPLRDHNSNDIGALLEWSASSESMRNYEGALAFIIESLHVAVQLKAYHRITMFLYTFFILIRFFRGFLGQPIIASIARTLGSAAQDLVHLAIMLGVTFENFVLGGLLLFGSEIREWSSVSLAHQSALAMISGLGDFASMYELYPLSATVWLFTFAMAVIFITFNMVLAIMVDHFRQVKTELGQIDHNIFEQGLLLAGDFYFRVTLIGKRFVYFLRLQIPPLCHVLPEFEESELRVGKIPYDDILDVLAPVCKDETLDPRKTAEMIKRMQAAKTGGNADIDWARGLPAWAPMQRDILTCLGCDPITAERLMEMANEAMAGKRPEDFPTDVLFHEFEGHMRSMYDQLAATDEDLRTWLSERRVDVDQIEPRQRKLELLAVEKILARPDESADMLVPEDLMTLADAQPEPPGPSMAIKN